MREQGAYIADLSFLTSKRLGEWLLRFADVGFVGVFLITALALGGRHDAGRFVYAVSVSVAAISLCLRGLVLSLPLRLPVWPCVLASLAIAVPVLQLVPLTPSVMAVVAPGHSDLLPMWTADSPLGIWPTISLTPQETLEGIALLLLHMLLFFAILNRIEGEEDARRLLAGIGLVALLMALLSVVQYLIPNGKLLWCYDHPFRRFGQVVQGSFANRNHLAHYLAFGIASMAPFALLTATNKKTKRPGITHSPIRLHSFAVLGVCGLLVMVVTLLATMSRGGAAALGAGALVAITMRWCVGRFRLYEALACVAFSTVVLVGVSVFDYESVTSRLDDLVSGEVNELDASSSRRLIWAANAGAIAANPWMGHGAGSHRYVYPAYLDQPFAKEFTHAESGYLQIACENGAAGLLVLALAIGSCCWWVISGLRSASTSGQVAIWSTLGAGIAISVVHSIIDFVWYVPSLCALVVAFAAIALRQRQIQLDSVKLTAARSVKSPKLAARRDVWDWNGLSYSVGAAIAVSIALTCLSGPASGSLCWDRYLRVSRSTKKLQQSTAVGSLAAHKNHEATIEDGEQRALKHLVGVLASDPRNARAHIRFVNSCLLAFNREVEQGNNPLTLAQIRDTVQTGGFGSIGQARQWLHQAFGDSVSRLLTAQQHAQLATAYCPLEPNSYLLSAELQFLDGLETPLDRWAQQALRLGQQDGGVHYELGRILHAAGRLDEALEQYRVSINLPGSHRLQLVYALAPRMPAQVFLESLEPDEAATELVFGAYRKAGSPEDLVAIAYYAERQALVVTHKSDRQAARCWCRLSTMNRSIDRSDAAIDCARRAHELLPYDFWSRQELGMSLYKAEQFNEAEPHLRWCLARRPDLRYLQQCLKLASEKRIAAERQQRDTKREATRLAARERIGQIDSISVSAESADENAQSK